MRADLSGGWRADCSPSSFHERSFCAQAHPRTPLVCASGRAPRRRGRREGARAEPTNDATDAKFGHAWRGDPADTRAMWRPSSGFRSPRVTVILSLNAMVIKAAAYQYSPRLVPLYLRNAPIRRALPFFVLLMGWTSLGALRELGLVADQTERPRRPLVRLRRGGDSLRRADLSHVRRGSHLPVHSGRAGPRAGA